MRVNVKPRIRSHEQFRKEFIGAHDCPKCHGKIIGIMVDSLGNTFCAYCGGQVNYPKATKEELERWFEDIQFSNCPKNET
uniref:Uncharacterized protein n=1 Tax=viral metagenome TaxID=1070528 RepID=A0A6M3IQJ9_9ZZZZ